MHPLLALALAFPLLVDTTHAAQRAEKRETLQQMLQRLRLQRDAVVRDIKGNVDAHVRALDEAAAARDMSKVEDAKRRLVALGSEVAALLMDYVDPGDNATDAVKLRASYLTDALIELKAPSVTTRAIEIARNGSLLGKLNTLRILGASSDSASAVPILAGLYRGGSAELRLPALIALARIGGSEATKILSEAISDGQPEIARAALEALGQAKNTSLAPRVLALVSTPSNALPRLEGILAYYRALPDLVDRTVLGALIKLAEEFTATAEQRSRVLDALPDFAERFDNEARRALRSISESPTKEVREGALIALYLVGDKAAKREVLAEYKAVIDQNQAWAGSYEARGNVLFRLREYGEAINDFTRSIQLARDDMRARPEQSYTGLARSYVMSKKPEKAADTLRKSTLTPKQLRDLAKDPVFAKMVEDPKFRDVFQLK